MTRFRNVVLLLVAVALQAGGVLSVKMLNGRHQQMFRTATISPACSTAMDRELPCPPVIQTLTYPDYALNLTLPNLQVLCASPCLSGVQALSKSLAASCAKDFIELETGKASFADLGRLVAQRTELLCLREKPSGGPFCQQVMSSWDVDALNASRRATWPKNDAKCLPNAEGECLTLAEMALRADSELVEEYAGVPARMFGNEHAAIDYWRNRSRVLELSQRHSLGAKQHLDWDEYPLEIQCNRCFWKTFAIGHQSSWAHMIWDEWTEKTWANMVKNCDIPANEALISPAINKTGIIIDEDKIPLAEEPIWESCPNTMIISMDNTDDIYEWAKKTGHSMACLRSFNPVLYSQAHQLRGVKMCLPLRCEVAVIAKRTSLRDYVAQQLEGVTAHQFLAWNKCLDHGSNLWWKDTVCTGPHRGHYTPVVVEAATSSVWTTTAIPSTPPPPRTIKNCGLYHNITVKDTCPRLSIEHGITVEMLRNMNPTIDSRCTNLGVGRSYCVAPVNGTDVAAVTTTFPAPPMTSTTSARPRTSP